jgi:type I restriction enzyme, S subunit
VSSSETRIVRLSDVCDFQNGYAFRNKDYVRDEGDTLTVFRMGNICRGGGFKHHGTQALVRRSSCEKLERFILQKNDILMSMTDMKASMALLGHTALMPVSDKYILNQRVGRITVKDSAVASYRYIYFCTNSPDYISHLRGRANSGVQVNLSTDVIKQSPLRLPPLPIQRKIASILSAYDDLIENNERRIRILEEMAQNLYREWFVKFGFPGHEKVKMVDSPLGKIPKGWEVKRLGEIIDFNPRHKVDKDTEKPYVAMGGLSTTSMLVRVTEYRTKTGGTKFQNGDTLFARITPCLENGKTGFVQGLPDKQVAIGSTEFIVMRSRCLPPEFVYLLARSDVLRDTAIKSMSGATGRQRVQQPSLDEFLLAVPPSPVLGTFADAVSPLFSNVHSLSRRNVCLRKTRDLLLPKLISGELDVSELEIDVPEEAV